MQLTTQLANRKIREVWRNDVSLCIRCEDGYELVIGWRDPDTGQPVKGEPIIVSAGKRIIANTTEVKHRGEVGL
jgi:hypothetical protein